MEVREWSEETKFLLHNMSQMELEMMMERKTKSKDWKALNLSTLFFF